MRLSKRCRAGPYSCRSGSLPLNSYPLTLQRRSLTSDGLTLTYIPRTLTLQGRYLNMEVWSLPLQGWALPGIQSWMLLLYKRRQLTNHDPCGKTCGKTKQCQPLICRVMCQFQQVLGPQGCASFGLSLAFPFCLPWDGFGHHPLLEFFSFQ